MQLLFNQPPAHGMFDVSLKEIVAAWFWGQHRVLLRDGYDGKNDGMIRFEAKYNKDTQTYRFGLFGGTRHESNAATMEKVLKSQGLKTEIDTSHTIVQGVTIKGTVLRASIPHKM